MNRPLFRAAVLFLATSAVGCSSSQSFDVTVTDKTSDPITVWMTKEKLVAGGAAESGWAPPEQLAVGTTGDHVGGVAIRPGDTGHTVLKGHIDSDDVAVLRVYRASDLNMILTLHRGSPDRLDIPLDPGVTDLDIVTAKGQIADIPHASPAQ
ncbi:MAG TPA: hypothetical protein VGG44_10645 [Tepidisphaeraceae bacterium]|jgi:hypothetical protein